MPRASSRFDGTAFVHPSWSRVPLRSRRTWPHLTPKRPRRQSCLGYCHNRRGRIRLVADQPDERDIEYPAA